LKKKGVTRKKNKDRGWRKKIENKRLAQNLNKSVLPPNSDCRKRKKNDRSDADESKQL
jgi:hypothetical protein